MVIFHSFLVCLPEGRLPKSRGIHRLPGWSQGAEALRAEPAFRFLGTFYPWKSGKTMEIYGKSMGNLVLHRKKRWKSMENPAFWMGIYPRFRLGHGFKFANCKRLPGRVTMKIWDFTNNGGKIWESQIKNMGVLSGYNEAKKQWWGVWWKSSDLVIHGMFFCKAQPFYGDIMGM